MRAGEYLAGKSMLPQMMDVVRRLAWSSAPLAVELFCGGVLGALVREARRASSVQPTAKLEGEVAGCAFAQGLPRVVSAFGRAVPQARTFPLPALSAGVWSSLRPARRCLRRPLCCAGRRNPCMVGERGARLRHPPLAHPRCCLGYPKPQSLPARSAGSAACLP